MLKNDVMTLESILANTFVRTDEEGHLSDRAADFAGLNVGDLKLAAITFTNLKVHVYGETAVVTGIAEQDEEKPLTSKVAFTDTFVRQNGVWWAVASHASSVK